MLALPCLKFPSILDYNDVTKEGDDTRSVWFIHYFVADISKFSKLSLALLQITNYKYSALKNVKKNGILFKLFWYKVFFHWKLKLLNFPMNCVLKCCIIVYCLCFLFLRSFLEHCPSSTKCRGHLTPTFLQLPLLRVRTIGGKGNDRHLE